MILFKLHVDLPNLNCRLHIISLYFLCSWFLLTLGQDNFFFVQKKIHFDQNIKVNQNILKSQNMFKNTEYNFSSKNFTTKIRLLPQCVLPYLGLLDDLLV